MNQKDVDVLVQSLGYQHLGGMAKNRVYLHKGHGEVLKIAVGTDPITIDYARAQFRRCFDISKVYVQQGIMPEVLATGDDFHGTGFPWLRERYIAGNNLGAAYLEDPGFWISHAPQEMVRTIKVFTTFPSRDITVTWQDKLAGMICPLGYEDIYEAVLGSGRLLAERFTRGYIIHGDLQFGNILVRRTRDIGHLWLIDWEVSEVMPLGYEFAMFYTFLLGPEAQVEASYQQRYDQLKPLRAFWEALAPMLRMDLGISEEELKHSVVFRMGNGWLYQLDRAIQQGNAERVAELEHDLRDLASGRCFEILPYP